MGSLLRFEERLAWMLADAKATHDKREGLEPDEHDDAVTAWRHLAHLANTYRGNTSWSGLWELTTEREFVGALRRGSRFNRCRPDGSAELNVNSVDRFEEELVSLADTGALELARSWVVAGRKDLAYRVRALELEYRLTMEVIGAYTGLPAESLKDLSTQYRTYAGEPTQCDPGSLLDTMGAERPTLDK